MSGQEPITPRRSARLSARKPPRTAKNELNTTESVPERSQVTSRDLSNDKSKTSSEYDDSAKKTLERTAVTSEASKAPVDVVNKNSRKDAQNNIPEQIKKVTAENEEQHTSSGKEQVAQKEATTSVSQPSKPSRQTPKTDVESDSSCYREKPSKNLTNSLHDLTSTVTMQSSSESLKIETAVVPTERAAPDHAKLGCATENAPKNEPPNKSKGFRTCCTVAHARQKEKDLTFLADRSSDLCSYKSGYINQEVFMCLTCLPLRERGSRGLAGVCSHCAETCHKSHAVRSVGFRSGFRCDCATENVSASCKFAPIGLHNQYESNSMNRYNMSFDGNCSRCSGLLVDPKAPAAMRLQQNTRNRSSNRETPLRGGKLYQCVICEEVLHDDCLELPHFLPRNYNELAMDLICSSCVVPLRELLGRYYTELGVSVQKIYHDINTDRGTLSDCTGCDAPEIGCQLMEADYFWVKGVLKSLCDCEFCESVLKRAKEGSLTEVTFYS